MFEFNAKTLVITMMRRHPAAVSGMVDLLKMARGNNRIPPGIKIINA